MNKVIGIIEDAKSDLVYWVIGEHVNMLAAKRLLDKIGVASFLEIDALDHVYVRVSSPGEGIDGRAYIQTMGPRKGAQECTVINMRDKSE